MREDILLLNEVRRKDRPMKRFYPSGALYSRYCPGQAETAVPEEVIPGGTVKAELVTYYESGAVKRLFPLYGQLSAYWTEEDEFSLLKEPVRINIPGTGVCPVYPADIFLYESGRLRAVTIWKRTSLTVRTERYGVIRTHFGAEFYEDGSPRSIEPAFGTKITMNGRQVHVFNPDVLRLHAENNSMKFDEEGNLIAWQEFTGTRRELSERERIFGVKLADPDIDAVSGRRNA